MRIVKTVIWCLLTDHLSLTFAQGPYNQGQNSYWPMTVGNKWVMKATNTNSPTVITVQPSPPEFGCVPIIGGSASSPFEIDLVKTNPANYWFPSWPLNLRWFLGVQPTNGEGGYAGSVLSFGWLAEDYVSSLQGTVSIGNSADAVTLTPPPTYNLIQAGGTLGTYSSLGYYPLPSASNLFVCASTSGAVSRQWDVTWTSASVSTPGYSGAAVKAAYLETGGTYQGQDNQENWYYAANIGPVKIEVYDPGTQTIAQTLELISYMSGSGAPVSPYVTLRDVLIAAAGTTGGLTYAQWATYFSQAMNLNSPTAYETCVNPFGESLPITVDAYLSDLEQVGGNPPYCTAVQYPTTPNGLVLTRHSRKWRAWLARRQD